MRVLYELLNIKEIMLNTKICTLNLITAPLLL